MSVTHRRLASASLDTAINDPSDRNIMHMSTLIASDQWLIETSWDGAIIGDVQIFRNLAHGANGQRIFTDEKGPDGKLVPMPDKWVWWGGVPRGKIKSYRFLDAELLTPQTIEEPLRFDLPPHAERKGKLGQASKEGEPTRA